MNGRSYRHIDAPNGFRSARAAALVAAAVLTGAALPRPAFAQLPESGATPTHQMAEERPVPFRLGGKLALARQWVLNYTTFRNVQDRPGQEQDEAGTDYDLTGNIGSFRFSYKQSSRDDRLHGRRLSDCRDATLTLGKALKFGSAELSGMTLSFSRDLTMHRPWTRKFQAQGGMAFRGNRLTLSCDDTLGGGNRHRWTQTIQFTSAPGRPLSVQGVLTRSGVAGQAPCATSQLDARFNAKPLTLHGSFNRSGVSGQPSTSNTGIEVGLDLGRSGKFLYQRSIATGGRRQNAARAEHLTCETPLCRGLGLSGDFRWQGEGPCRTRARSLWLNVAGKEAGLGPCTLRLGWAAQTGLHVENSAVLPLAYEFRYAPAVGKGNTLELTARWAGKPGVDDLQVNLNADIKW